MCHDKLWLLYLLRNAALLILLHTGRYKTILLVRFEVLTVVLLKIQVCHWIFPQHYIITSQKNWVFHLNYLLVQILVFWVVLVWSTFQRNLQLPSYGFILSSPSSSEGGGSMFPQYNVTCFSDNTFQKSLILVFTAVWTSDLILCFCSYRWQQ